jgi:hypothetical protein
MKINLLVILFLGFFVALNAACSKTDATATAATTGSGNTSTDPAVIILGRWQVVKDSIVTHNFAFPNGDIPIPGVYTGGASDYWNFQSNGTLIIQEGGPQLSSTYHVLSASSLLVDGFDWGNVTIITLNSRIFTWEKVITSSNGGTYYRKAYFSR